MLRDPEKQKQYLRNVPVLQILYNQERFNPDKYGDERIVKESTFLRALMPSNAPSLMMTHLSLAEIEDEADLVQFGQTETLEYHHLEADPVRAHHFIDDLLVKPNGTRSLSVFQLSIAPMKQMTVRQTYGLLDYFGDIGGLLDFLYYLIVFVLAPFWQYIYSSHMLTSLFRTRPDGKA